MKIVWSIFLLAVAAVALAGCTASSPAATPATPVSSPTAQAPTPTPSAQAAPATASVSIKDFSFQPGTVTVARGGTVTWTNDDAATHTVKFANDESPGMQKGGAYSKTFDAAGSYDYSCGIHPSMRGTVKVV